MQTCFTPSSINILQKQAAFVVPMKATAISSLRFDSREESETPREIGFRGLKQIEEAEYQLFILAFLLSCFNQPQFLFHQPIIGCHEGLIIRIDHLLGFFDTRHKRQERLAQIGQIPFADGRLV